ncbi:MAG: GDSL-type esterase/lipase family protein [Verrucomicrobiales bacterium]|nr:GDSL-type esterase/lipase family protein [Verrucomicrobiales bacterium]
MITPRLFLITFLALTTGISAQEASLKWESSIAGFEARDAKSPPEENTILFVGSSSIRMWDLNTSWPESPTVNNGFGGSTLADSIHYFDRLFTPYAPAAVVLYAGDNDINKGLSPEEVAKDFKTLASLISDQFPETPVIYIAIKPSEARWKLWPEMKQANDLVASLCQKNAHWHFADIAAPMLKGREGAPQSRWFIEDGLHLSRYGYEEWTGIVKLKIREAGVKD